MARKAVLKVGQEVILSMEDYRLAVDIGHARTRVGASETRGASRWDHRKHVDGALGEMVVRRALGLTTNPECFDHNDKRPDIRDEIRPPIEVKYRTPVEKRWVIRSGNEHYGAFYVVVHYDMMFRFTIARLSIGEAIIQQKLVPEVEMLPRDNGATIHDNWVIPSLWNEVSVWVL